MQQFKPSEFAFISTLWLLPAIIFLSVILAACKKEPAENPSSQSNFDLGVAQVLTPDNPLIAVYSDKEGKETLSILGTKDAVFGSPLSFTQIIEGTAHFLCKTKSTAWCWYPN